MEELLAGAVPGFAPRPTGPADALLDQAARAASPERAAELCRQAIAAAPDCVDAYMMLADLTPSRPEALRLHEQAVAAGERALGPQLFQEQAGHFWGLLETRPYMRARQALAYSLWMAGRREEAIAHLQEMLRLNPNDNQGLRYILANWLLDQNRDAEAAALVQQYDSDSTAAWAYTRALLGFRRERDTPETRQLLQEAKKKNKYVPDYLLGEKLLPVEHPDSYILGQDSEAVAYAGGALPVWRATAGAVDWAQANLQASRKKQPAEPAARGPTPLVQGRLGHLPQRSEVWQLDYRCLPTWMETRSGPTRPWTILVLNRTDTLVLANNITHARPTPQQVYDQLSQAMQRPMAGMPGRPTEVEVLSGAGLEALRLPLEGIGIRFVERDELDMMNVVAGDLAEHMREDDMPGLLTKREVTPELVGRVYEAAAEFYQQAPWRRLGYESAIQVECDRYPGGPWYAVIMGGSGMTMGLTLYDDLEVLQRMWSEQLSQEENADLTEAITLTFGRAYEMPMADLEAAEHFGWKVAGNDAYPWFFRKERGMNTHPPELWQLQLLEACLRAVPQFVQRRHQDDPAAEVVTVKSGTEEIALRLSWVQT
jgi:hypothetical protein